MQNLRQAAYENRGSLIAKIIAHGNIGYNVQLQDGSIIKGVASSGDYPIGLWVTVARTNTGYAIIGLAATGPGSIYEPPTP